jgi:hypothetical protein
MLMGAGFSPFKSTDRVFPILIDYDTTNGDTTRTKDLIACYHEINAAVYPDSLRDQERYNGEFFSTPLMEMKELGSQYHSGFAMQFGADSQQTFELWTGMQQLLGSKSHTADLLNSLYDNSNDENAELKLKMDVGFKGNPNIGSIVFHSLKDTDEFADFAGLCQEDDKVVIVGSLFGGTGSSGIPELVQAIRNHNRVEVRDVALSVVMVCPYFGFSSQDEKAVRSSIFNSKTKAALNFYETSGLNEKINAIYYVGDKQTSNFKYCEGGINQRNCTHIVDLVSALSICHFAEKQYKATETEYYKYRVAELDANEKPKTNDTDADAPSNILSFTNLIETELDHVFYPLAAFALALRYFHQDIVNGSKNCTGLAWYQMLNLSSCFKDGQAVTADTGDRYENDLRACCNNLIKFYELFCEWNDELKQHNSHSLRLFNFDENKPLCQFIVDGELKTTSKKLGFSNETNRLKPDVVDQLTTNAWHRMSAVNTFSIDSKYKAHMLVSLLTRGCRAIFLESTDSKIKTPAETTERRTHLAGKLVRVGAV